MAATEPLGAPGDGALAGNLFGVWSLRDRLSVALSAEEHAASTELVVGAAARVEHRSERLWLVASRDTLVEHRGGVAAYVGFLATGTTPARRFLAEGGLPDGHFALVVADLERGVLSLTRSLSAGEHLYFIEADGAVLFATTLRGLLASPRVRRRVNLRVANEVLLCGHPLFGDGTPLEGIREVHPGHTLRIEGAVGRQRLAWPRAFEPDAGPVDQVARRFRRALEGAVEASVGSERPVVVALSGGIDSSAVMAAAVDVVGADAVEAVSYEFDDPTHGVETHFAKSVSRSLGIRRHHVFKIGLRQFLDGVPEAVWRAESGVYWPKAFLVPVTRHLAARGVTRHLTGFGIGSHFGYFEELSAVLPHLPVPDLLLRYWRAVRFGGRDELLHLARIHPGLEPPHPRLYDLLLHHLERTGHVRDRRRFYPKELAPLLGGAAAWDDLEPELGALPLGARLGRHAFTHGLPCVDVTRCEKLSRELGVLRISPAHFATTLRYAFLPPFPLPPLRSEDRRLRPGKLLLRHAYRGVLPDEVLLRRKSWADAVASPAWRRKARVLMLRALPSFPRSFADLGPRHVEAVRFWEPRSILASALGFAFWRELFEHREPTVTPPTWDDLIVGGRDVARVSPGAFPAFSR